MFSTISPSHLPSHNGPLLPHLLNTYYFSRGKTTAEGLSQGLPHAKEQGLPCAAGQEAAQELRDTEAAGRSVDTLIHLWKHRPGLAQMYGKSGQAQDVRGTQAWALKYRQRQ